MTNLAVFSFNDQEVCFVDEKPVANDVARVLGYADPAKTISTKVKDKNKSVTKMVTVDGKLRDVMVLEEAGIYQLIFGSKLPAAEKFQDWVFEEVLPSIRKTGGYSAIPTQKPLPLAVDSIKDTILAIYGHTNIDQFLLAKTIANEIGKHRPELKALTDSVKQSIPQTELEDRLMLPGKLAEIYESKTGIKLSSQKINKLLESKGLQFKNPSKNPSWLPTEEGKQYSKVILDVARGHNKTVQSLQWYPSVIEVI